MWRYIDVMFIWRRADFRIVYIVVGMTVVGRTGRVAKVVVDDSSSYYGFRIGE